MLLVTILSAWLMSGLLSLAICQAAGIADAELAAELDSRLAMLRRASVFN